jgi:hypothetical protein
MISTSFARQHDRLLFISEKALTSLSMYWPQRIAPQRIKFRRRPCFLDPHPGRWQPHTRLQRLPVVTAIFMCNREYIAAGQQSHHHNQPQAALSATPWPFQVTTAGMCAHALQSKPPASSTNTCPLSEPQEFRRARALPVHHNLHSVFLFDRAAITSHDSSLPAFSAFTAGAACQRRFLPLRHMFFIMKGAVE